MCQLADWVKQSRVKSGDHQFHRPINACLRQLISDAPGQIELSAAAAEAPVMGNPSDVGISLCDDVMVVVIPPVEYWPLIFRCLLDTSLPVSTYVARRRPIAAAYFLCAELRLLIDVVYHCGVPLWFTDIKTR